MIENLRSSFIIQLLFVITVGLYLYSLLEVNINQNVLSLDDGKVLNYLANHELQLKEVLSPTWDGKYYRPVVGVSYLIDQRLWEDYPFGYRLTNVLIHTLNVILLYLVSRRLLKFTALSESVPFFAALLFSVHPIAVESVSWISGRTDPLATFWSLCAILFYLLSKEKRRWHLLFLSILFMILAVLSKEVGLATPIIMASFELFYGRSFGYERGRYSLPLFALLILVVPLYLKLRSGIIFSEDVSLNTLKEGLSMNNLSLAIKMIFASLGFYLKKFLFPYPLNFAIYKINVTLYYFIGLVSVLVFCAAVFYKKIRTYHFLLFWALLALGPATILSFVDIAWTKWGERYLYFSMAPLSIASAVWITSFAESINQEGMKRIVLLVSFCILPLFAASSIKRSHLMNDNVKIWADSKKKSPEFIEVAVAYTGALLKREKISEAEHVLIKAKDLSGAKHTLYLYLGHIYNRKGEYEKAENYYFQALREAREDKRLVTVGPSLRKTILTAIGYNKLRPKGIVIVNESNKINDRRDRYLDGIKYLIKATEETSEPSAVFLFYKIGQLFLEIEEEEKAAVYLRKFAERWQGEQYYIENAKTMLKKIGKSGS